MLLIRSTINYLKPFLNVVICFFIVVFIIKSYECTLYLLNNKAVVISVIGEMLYTNIIACSFLSSCTLLLFALIKIRWEKVALWISSSFLGLWILAEISLGLYTERTGLLMGIELIVRPFSEIMQTIKSAVNTGVILCISIVGLFLFDLFAIWFHTKKIKNSVLIIFLISMFVSIPLFFAIKPYSNDTVINRTWYCLKSCINYVLSSDHTLDSHKNLEKIPYDPVFVNQYLSMFPKRIVPDSLYPMEYIDNTPNVLGPFFPSKNEKPNIAIIIVESLGTDWFCGTKEQTCYTPYLDSLSKHSLLWLNCLSATHRSFGAVPAITGSVPHGIKGFQFGAMPQHNSLISILKANDYQTNAFYASDFSFDNVLDYLLAQHIDYLSPFHNQATQDKSKSRDATYWGYNDEVMLKKSLEHLNQTNTDQPLFNLYITISTHDNINIYDKQRQQFFIDKAKTIISSHSKELQEKEIPHLQKYAAMLYADNAIKQFMEAYSKRPDYENTLFIFTGDHAYGINRKNIFSPNHVPLIIWSPMLLRSQVFPALVSHNDITPSVNALLKHNFNLNTPNTVHWIGTALDTSHFFQSKQRTYLLQYAREVKEFIFDEYLRTEERKAELFKIGPHLELQKMDDQKLLSEINAKMEAMLYVDFYAYLNNRLTKHPIWEEETFHGVFSFQTTDSIVCRVPDVKPSDGRISQVPIIEPLLIMNNQEWTKLRVSMTADAYYEKLVYQDSFILLKISCNSKNSLNSVLEDDISKFFTHKKVKPNEWTKVRVVKDFLIKDVTKPLISIQLQSTKKDHLWVPEHQVILKNIQIEIGVY